MKVKEEFDFILALTSEIDLHPNLNYEDSFRWVFHKFANPIVIALYSHCS